ncbi:hypothetical protein L1049_002748 [Liquidambar formosana]|uniref:Uncharacterized protein n=1 Tax=Liquidambar formosana TaxID=63359 RepID=A0AAP0NI28_LIQFO
MSSIGVSFAEVYVLRERQKEKMRRMDEERARRSGEGRCGDEKKVGGSALGRKKKKQVHPSSLPPPDSAGESEGNLG